MGNFCVWESLARSTKANLSVGDQKKIARSLRTENENQDFGRRNVGFGGKI